MKHLPTLLCTAALFFSCGVSNTNTSTTTPNNNTTANPVSYANTITQAELKTLLYTYASDEFQGRETGKKGQKLAVDYLKNQYKALNIPSPLGGDTYFQNVDLEKQKVSTAQITINNTNYTAFDDHIVLRTNANFDLTITDMVYAGYGIDDANYSDYESIDVKNKIVLIKAGEIIDSEGNYITSGKSEPTKWTNGRQALSSKRNAAIKNGAKGLIYIDDALFARYSPYYKTLASENASGSMALITKDADFFMLMGTTTLGKAFFNAIDKRDDPHNFTTNAKLKINNIAEPVTSENVVAFIEGSEKPNEILVISAHLDHEGVKNGEVYNGADDDGSGTVAMLEIAEAFKQAKNEGFGPKRSILFLHVTAEEKGLLGSRHYTDNDPIFPLANTIANLNIDMIGRTDPKRKSGERNYIYLIGSDKLSTELHDISEMVNLKYCNIELDYTFNDDNDPNRFYYRSDHYNFAKHNVPIIFYFNGTHDDYHQPSDTPDKIEYDLLENRTRLVFYTAWELANRKDRVIVDKAFK